jgi:hypothetical protein
VTSTASLRFVTRRSGATNPQKKLEMEYPVGPGKGKPVGNEPFARMDGPGYSMTCE